MVKILTDELWDDELLRPSKKITGIKEMNLLLYVTLI